MAPVAVVLALALLAVPFVLRQKPEAATVAPTAAAPSTEAADSQLAVKALEEATLPSSDLGVFDPKDPFKPLPRPKADLSAGQATLPPSSTSTSTGNAVADAGATVAGGGSSSGGGSSGGGAPGGSSPVSGGGGKTPASTPQTTTPKRKFYTYVVDIEFGKTGEERTRKGVKRLTILPNNDNPLLVFLGVQTDGKRVVFLADSSLSQAGEGKCEPDGDTCTFLELQDVESKDEHFLTDEGGQEYRIKLLDIRRVELKPAKKRSAKKSSAKPRARAGKTAPRESNIFETLLFADESR